MPFSGNLRKQRLKIIETNKNTFPTTIWTTIWFSCSTVFQYLFWSCPFTYNSLPFMATLS